MLQLSITEKRIVLSISHEYALIFRFSNKRMYVTTGDECKHCTRLSVECFRRIIVCCKKMCALLSKNRHSIGRSHFWIN